MIQPEEEKSQPEEEKSQPEEEKSQPEEEKVQPLTQPEVLVVDDDPMQVEIVTSLIHIMRNIQCDSVFSSSQALNFVRTRLDEVLQGRATMYKIILLDYSIDEMDGPQIAHTIR